METEKIIETGAELVNKANGNVKVIIGSAVATMAVAAGVYFGCKKIKAVHAEKKTKKDPEVVTVEAQEVKTEEK